ncbi:hypothetical protein QBC32DRAFT_369764 [Pseudoneurospora amorphoporcata]|uniref:Uncharacterized protein n=1 Tax=Pseudoneurospora amorphoporcata TaxID=241081 RepID=A0AAN6SG36_9PEZI|nr:hypothetical protein QBC32DRAFT_369764 [Pseudoneurospora amorphoporcata]
MKRCNAFVRPNLISHISSRVGGLAESRLGRQNIALLSSVNIWYCMRHQRAAGPGTLSMRLYRIVSDRIVCTMPPPPPQPMEMDAPDGSICIPSRRCSGQDGLCCKKWAGLEQDAWPLSARPVATQGRTTTDSCLAVLQLASCPCACEFVIPSDSSLALASGLALF